MMIERNMPLVQSLHGLALLLFCGVGNVHADPVTEEDVQNYLKGKCWGTERYHVDVEMAPVSKVDNRSDNDDGWGYVYDSQCRCYKGEVVHREKDAAANIFMVTTVNRNEESSIGESYIWNVIIGPKPRGWQYGGHWVMKRERVADYNRLLQLKEPLGQMVSVSSFKESHDRFPGHPLYFTVDLGDSGQRETLFNAWSEVFGAAIVQNVIDPAAGIKLPRDRGYGATMFYVPVPAMKGIQENGYRWPNSKLINRDGKVFGLALSPEGMCLDFDAVTVISEE